MFGERRTRTLIGAADPVRSAGAPPPPRVPAAELIARAEAADPGSPADLAAAPAEVRRPRRVRRLVLVAGLAAVVTGAAAVAYPIVSSTGDDTRSQQWSAGAGAGLVLVPVAYEVESDPPDAASHLRDLAGRLVDAPYEHRTGRFTYHRVRMWGNPLMIGGAGRYVMSYASEAETWRLADGSGRQRSVPLPPEYPDAASRDYWQREAGNQPPDPGFDGPLGDGRDSDRVTPLPSDRAGLARLLHVDSDAGTVVKAVTTIYHTYVVPKQTRALILDILADVPGFAWRGHVTDRAGRAGVAVTYDQKGQGKDKEKEKKDNQQALLVFDERTGALLAHENVVLEPHRVSTYLLILDTDRREQAR